MNIVDAGTIFGFSPKERRDLSLDTLLRSMEQYGVERFLSLSLKGALYEHGEGNRETLRASQEHPQMIPVATLDPRRYAGYRDEIAWCVDHGFRVFRFFPERQGWPARLLPFWKILETLTERQIPFIFPWLAPGAITEVIERVRGTGTPVIFEGVNYSGFAEVLAVLEEEPHSYAATSNLDGPDTIELFAREIGADRLIFSSNSPFFSFSAPFLTVERSMLSEEEKKQVLGGNIERVLGVLGCKA